MDFRSLYYFTVVAQELNFTRAAEKLGMSQPPLSNAIKGLEQDLGVTLFCAERDGCSSPRREAFCCTGPTRC